MEKIFNLDQLQNAKLETNEAEVYLKRQHLCLSAKLATNAFNNERQVYVVFYPQQGSLLLAPMSDSNFKQLHKCALAMLKDKNLKGDKSLSLQEVIIDNDLPTEDRPLPYAYTPGFSLLQVNLNPTME